MTRAAARTADARERGTTDVDRIIVHGGTRLKGTVRVNGAKNAALPVMAATLLPDGPCLIEDVPDVQDVRTLLQVLHALGVRHKSARRGELQMEVTDPTSTEPPRDLVTQMRGSVCVLGPLLARRGRARLAVPGGCKIGVRPIDLHLKGLRALGASITVIEEGNEHGEVVATAARLRGARLFLAGASGTTVLGTDNVMMAATLAEGVTTIEAAACEPEVADLARFLTEMGASIEGAGTATVRITGVPALHGARHRIIPDRIEAATFMVAAAITRGDVTLENVRLDHLAAVVDVLRKAGVQITPLGDDACRVIGPDTLKPVDVAASPYPGFPTDVQAQLLALLCLADGTSTVTDTVFPQRFTNVPMLQQMGAALQQEGPSVTLRGVRALRGASVDGPDLRASASLVLAGLAAQGTTELLDARELDRGYERIEERLRALGADIQRVPVPQESPVLAFA